MEDSRKAKLRAKLRSKIGEKRIQRSNKQLKNKTMEKVFEDNGIDKDKFNESLEILSKYGNNKEYA
jgi:hypothetical protein